MYNALVNNYIDCMETRKFNDPFIAVIWTIAMLQTECRSGRGDISFHP